ncbi:MAG: CRP/FNR family transcriptional regulator [Pseudohongiellaceae bacterium]|jgi:CRP/FNR family transcriptional regulator
MTQISGVNQLESAVNPMTVVRSLNSGSLANSSVKENRGGCRNSEPHSLYLAGGLSAMSINKLDDAIRPFKKLCKGQHLYRQSDEFESIYFIRSGSVKSYIDNPDGHEVAVSFFFTGEAVGLDGVFSREYTSSIVALQDTFFCEIPFVELQKLMSSRPLLQQNFNELLSRQIVQEQSVTILRGQKTASDRVAAFLLNLSERYARIGLSSRSFWLPMSRKDIAGCLGMTTETVSRQFSIFKEKGWLEVHGKEITLTNLPSINSKNQVNWAR